MQTVIEVTNLVHSFGEVHAINDISFTVQRGEIFALLGPNGAGKTTTVRLVNGLFPPSRGSIRILGLDPVTNGDQIRLQTGVLTETPALYERLTAWQNIEFFGTLAGMSDKQWRARGQELLQFFDLEKRAQEKVATYSKGMKQRLALARALLSNPPVLFLDEPTSGLDPEAAGQVHDLIQTIRTTHGQTVVLCTHNLVEAERLCDRVAILQRGHILAIGSLLDLRKTHDSGVWVEIDLLQPIKPDLPASIHTLPGVLKVEMLEKGQDKHLMQHSMPHGMPHSMLGAVQDCSASMRVQLLNHDMIPDLAVYLVQQGARLAGLRPQEISLEDVYFKLQNQAKGVSHELA
jgi:ABC-2 type transport system ATP-binding protein